MKKILPLIIIMAAIITIPLISLFNNKSPDKNKNPIEKIYGQDIIFYKVLNHKTGEVMELSPHDYIVGVVGAEMPISFHTEALKAQAVAAHSYALRQIDEELRNSSPELKGAYLTTDFHINQAYLSKAELEAQWGTQFDSNYKKLDDAVTAVINKIMTLDDKPIIAAFHSISSGITESAKTVWGKDVSYLTPVISEGDELSPNYEVKTSITKAEVQHAFKQKYPDIEFDADEKKWFEIKARTDSNTISEIMAGSICISGKDVREILNLKSADFEVAFENGCFIFTTKGYGHGVGMSQYGADYLARQGKKYDEILKHYYSGVTIDDFPPYNAK